MNNKTNHHKIISLKSEDNSSLIKLAIELNGDENKNMLFLSHKESSFVVNSFKTLRDDNQKLSQSYPNIRFMFLRESWSVLDQLYGKTFFINEIQKMMKEEDFETLYFHRSDTFFDGAPKRDIERVILDIVEISRYYHKEVIFSSNEKTVFGQIMDEVLSVEADLEYIIQKDSDGEYKTRMTKCKKEHTNIVLFSDKKEILDFHKYIFKKDPNINFLHIKELDEKSQVFLEDSDIVIFNLDNIPLKDNLLSFINKQKLRTKFLFLSDEKVIRKRDKISKIKKGILQVYEKHFDLLEYIYAVEKIIGRDFYTSIFKSVNIVPANRYCILSEEFKNVIYNFTNYHIFFSIVATQYESNIEVDEELVGSCVRELDVVYHDKGSKNLLFLLVDILPSNGLSLITERLDNKKVSLVTKQTFNADDFISMMGEEFIHPSHNKKKLDKTAVIS